MISEIENAIIARLKARLAYLVDAFSYQGSDPEAVLQQLIRRMPATAVVFTGADFERVGQKSWRKVGQFKILVAVQNLRSEQARRQGSGSEKGAYKVIEDIESALIFKDLGLEIEPLLPLEVQNLFSDQVKSIGVSAYGLTFQTAWVVEEAEEEAIDLTGIEGEFSLKPALDDGPHGSNLIDLVEE